MKFWLDTTNVSTIQAAKRLGILFGITTNPAIIAESEDSLENTLHTLLEEQDGPVTAQVTSSNIQEMVKQGEMLSALSDRLIIKVPVTQEGLEVIRLLSVQNIPTMATVVFQPHQALLAALAGADYVAPYLGQIEQHGQNPWLILSSISQMFNHYDLKTEILGASMRSLEYIQRCAEMGISSVTLKDSLFYDMIATVPATQERVDYFEHTWNKTRATFL